MSNQSFEILRAYFEGVDERERSRDRHEQTTDVGVFVPCSLTYINVVLQKLIQDRVIDPTAIFLDAGSGDGRIVCLASGVYRIPSIGVEYDPEIATRSRRHIGRLRKLSLLDEIYPIIATGDFRRDETYEGLGINFGEIGTVFNFASNQREIAHKIAMQSPEGTVFLLCDFNSYGEQFDGLRFQRTMEEVEEYIDVSDPENPTKSTLFQNYHLHVYRK